MTKKEFTKEELTRLIEVKDEEELKELREILKTISYSTKPIKKEETTGDKVSDTIAKAAGSWPFIIGFLVLMIGWITFNAIFKNPDPFPFILLNLMLSMIAAIQAPLILMSQNREEERNKQEMNADFFINVKSELLLEDLHERLTAIEETQKEILKRLGA